MITNIEGLITSREFELIVNVTGSEKVSEHIKERAWYNVGIINQRSLMIIDQLRSCWGKR